MTEKYEKYLDKIGPFLQKFFKQQEEYIRCKAGCAICCETGEYPFSKPEFDYAMKGYQELSDDEKKLIDEKVREIKKQKREYLKSTNKEAFMHECPFLINKKCSIYEHRGIICRSYGLMFFTTDKNGQDKLKMPCCVDMGLNYSNVYDPKTKMISAEKWKASGIEAEPVSYNVGLDFLTDNSMTQELGLEIKEQKPMIDWFEEKENK